MTTIKVTLGFIAFLGLYALAGIAGTFVAQTLSNVNPLIALAVIAITVVVLIHKAARKYL